MPFTSISWQAPTQEVSGGDKLSHLPSSCKATCGNCAPLLQTSTHFFNSSPISSGWTPRAEWDGFLVWTSIPYVAARASSVLMLGKPMVRTDHFKCFFKWRITILWSILALMSFSSWLAFPPPPLVRKYFHKGAGFWEARLRKHETRSSDLSTVILHFCCFALQVWKGDIDPFPQFPAQKGRAKTAEAHQGLLWSAIKSRP